MWFVSQILPTIAWKYEIYFYFWDAKNSTQYSIFTAQKLPLRNDYAVSLHFCLFYPLLYNIYILFCILFAFCLRFLPFLTFVTLILLTLTLSRITLTLTKKTLTLSKIILNPNPT